MSYGLPYKGSKSRIANELIACLPNAENFYDMFVGGGAVTHRALLEGRWRNVFINDINPLIPQLFLDSVNGKYHNCTRWVSREEFHEQKATDGLVAVCYSFGNNLRQYLYNEDVEPYKRAFHIAVAERDYAPMQEFGVDLSPVDSISDIHWRRIEAQNIVAENENENIQRCSTCETLSRYERLQWLERLNRFKDKLHMTSIDYRDVEIKPNSLIYCFDKDTEILTNHGWKLLKDVDIVNDEFLSREPDTANLEWVKADAFINYPYKGKMYHYKGKEVDLMVTPNHRIFCAKKRTRKQIIREEFVEASDFFNHIAMFVSAGGKWHGENPVLFDLCGELVDFEEFSYLFGVFLADGCVNVKGLISISQKKANICTKIEASLKKLGIKHTIYRGKEGRGNTYYISRKYLDFFNQFRGKEHRIIPRVFKDASVSALNRLLEGLLDGDSDYERRKIITGSRALVDDIIEIAYKIGKSAAFVTRAPQTTFLAGENRYIVGKKPFYIVSLKNKEYIHHGRAQYGNEAWVNYDDMVYCIRLVKWHTVLVRRNGKPIWCGQCDIPYINTDGYVTDFNHDEFYDWACNQENPVYISSYWMPEDRFDCVMEFANRSTFSRDSNSTEATERLFIPKGQHHIKTTLF